jgi:hypothetical protein
VGGGVYDNQINKLTRGAQQHGKEKGRRWRKSKLKTIKYYTFLPFFFFFFFFQSAESPVFPGPRPKKSFLRRNQSM